MGAGRVIVIDQLEHRLEKARTFAHAEMLDFNELDDVVLEMKKMTDYLGADLVIDAVGAEADGNLIQHLTAARSSCRAARRSRSTGPSTASARAAPSPSSAPTGRSSAR